MKGSSARRSRRSGAAGEPVVATLRAAEPRDMEAILALLQGSGLPTADLPSARVEFVVACEGTRIVGVGGLERFDQAGLLRSVAVAPDRRGAGIGPMIVGHLEARARARGLPELVLLTQTAKDFFEWQGYRVIERLRAPSSVQDSEEFRSLCPDSAFCMSKRMTESHSLGRSHG
jgi:amino-acid N-acetyltransferase